MKLIAKHHAFPRLCMALLFIGVNLFFAPSLSSAITVGEEYRGGIVFYVDESGEHGLVAAKKNISGHSRGMSAEEFTWYDAKAACTKFVSGGVRQGWHLPNSSELRKLYLQKERVGGFNDHFYWSSSREDEESAWYLYFYSGDANHEVKMAGGRVRPVLAF